MTVHGATSSAAARHTIGARPHRDRLVHGARRRHRRRAAHPRRRARRPAHDPARVRAPRPALRARRRRHRRARRPEARRSAATPATTCPRSRTAPGRRSRPTSPDRARAGDAGRGLGADPREDVREPPVLHRQARRDGRGRSRSATRTGRSSSGPRRLRGERVESPGHPRRHGDADRRPVRRRDAARSATSARSTAATSASTSACASSARASSASRPSPSLSDACLSNVRRTMIDPIPSGTRDVLPDEMRELRAITDALRARVRARRLRRGLHAGARVRGSARARRTWPTPRPPTGCSTSRATCSCCART